MAGLPPRDGDVPLQELGRDALSVFLFVAFTGKELLELVRELGLSVPGYRLEGLSDAERADLLADEIRAAPATRAPIVALLRKIYEFPAFDAISLSREVAGEFAALAVETDALVRILWRVLADPSKEIRAEAGPALAALVKAYYGPAPKAPPEAKRAPAGADRAAEGADEGRERARLEKELARAEADAKRAKEREDEARESVDAFRADVAAAQKSLAALRAEKDALARKLAAAEGKLEAAKKGAAPTGAAKKAAAAEERMRALEERARAAEAGRDALEKELARAERAKEAAESAKPAAAASADEDAVEAAPATWALPRFTREFYDSLKDWDPHAQRLAFKQAMLLAENHRHPSLRAIPLEGLSGYFRVRVASDLRLIYRRADRDVEILALIDREDLDRYVRQAKTR